MIIMEIAGWIANLLVLGIACLIWAIALFFTTLITFEIITKIKGLLWKELKT